MTKRSSQDPLLSVYDSFYFRVILGLLACLPLFAQSAQAQCGCGPTYCKDTPEYSSSLSLKKAAAKKAGFPDRLIVLYDRLDRCEACIRSSPDSFSLLRQDAEGKITVDAWTRANEKYGAIALEKGKLKACVVILARRAFGCCDALVYNKRVDYDAELDLSRDGAIACAK